MGYQTSPFTFLDPGELMIKYGYELERLLEKVRVNVGIKLIFYQIQVSWIISSSYLYLD